MGGGCHGRGASPADAIELALTLPRVPRPTFVLDDASLTHGTRNTQHALFPLRPLLARLAILLPGQVAIPLLVRHVTAQFAAADLGQFFQPRNPRVA